MKTSNKLVFAALLALMPIVQTSYAIDTSALGTVSGSAGGISRIASLEDQLHNITVKAEHPRVMLTPELLALARQRVAANHYKWSSIVASANAGNTINAAFAYLITGSSSYATAVYNKIMAQTATTWPSNYTSAKTSLPDRKVAEWAIAFDWVYNGLTQSQQQNLINKIAASANISGRAAWIAGGGRDTGEAGETFHREEWIFYAWKAWPEIALANHIADADTCYKARWRYDWVLGDAARLYAYLNDGTPLEGYQYGADGTSWFMALKSATGINLIDGQDLHYDVSAADYQLYGMDFGLNRNVFHHGVGLGAGGLATYTDTTGKDFNWKTKEYHSMASQLTAQTNPFQQWFAQNVLKFDNRGASSWIFSNEYYGFWDDFENITTLLFYDPFLTASDPRRATYEELPYAKNFPGGNEVYMRSSWGNDAAMACFRAAPAFSKTSHGDFDVNTFLLYRKGNLAPDSGVYDTYQGQTNYFGYQKNTVAHNDVLIIDPAKPNAPTKLGSNSPDPGGTEKVSERTFGNLHPSYPSKVNTFLLNNPADWGKIVAFQTTKDFDYAVGEAAKAYGTRANEFSRSMVFLRKASDKAYVMVYDRINSTNASFQKKWLLHTINEPVINGTVLNTEVDGHIYTVDGDTYSATNVYNNSALYGKVLLPKNHRIRKIGGAGYEFWVDGSLPKNWSIDWTVLAADKEPYMGGPVQEIGQWRLELMPATQQNRDLFLNVIYLGDAGETPAPVDLVESAEGNMTGAYIKDDTTAYVMLFSTAKEGATVTGTITYTLPVIGSGSPQQVLTGLVPNGSYLVNTIDNSGTSQTFQIVAGNDPTKGNVYSASEQGVLTIAAITATATIVTPPDTMAPTVNLDNPVAYANVTGRTIISANATDNVGVARVDFYVNSALRGAVNTWPYQFAWDTTAEINGPCTVSAKAYDGAGNVTEAETRTVNVFNDKTAPSVSMTAPYNNITASGTITVSASANDDVAVTMVQFYVNGVRQATATNAPYNFTWNTSATANGTYTIYAKAYDAAGNFAQSADVVVNVLNDTTAPTITFVSPTANYVYSQKTNLAATATDNVSVAKMELYVDGALQSTTNSGSLSQAVSLSKGAHTIQFRAYDRSNNVGTKAMTINRIF
jgi:hypothetical protein